MTDQNKILQDISLLYELSLSIGNSLNPVENCRRFISTLISRKSLNFGSIWLYPTEDNPLKEIGELYFIHPNFRQRETTISTHNPVIQQLATHPFLTIPHTHPDFHTIVQEKNVQTGSYAIFPMGDLGFLKLFATNRPDGFSNMEMAQLKAVIDKLKISLDGCFAVERLQSETANRIVAQKALEDSNQRYVALVDQVVESENKLRQIIDSSLDAVVSVGADGYVQEWNTQAEKMFGYTRQEATRHLLKHLIIPERFQELYEQVLIDFIETTQGTAVNKRFDIKCRHRSGTEFHAELSINADKNNKNMLFIGFIRDITESRKAKKEIETARLRLSNLITSMHAGILMEDDKRQISLINSTFCQIFSIPVAPESIIGLDCRIASQQAKHLFIDPDGFIERVEQIIEDRAMVTNETLFMADGRIMERDFIPLHANDKYQGHFWQYRDVTERHHAQMAIRESEEKYRGALENMELGLLEVDLQDTIIRPNNAFCKMLGYTPQELIGKNLQDLAVVPDGQDAKFQQFINRKSEPATVYEIQLRKKNGESLWGLISGAPVRNSQGQVVGSIEIQFDLTTRKKLETELAAAKQTAEKARLAERQFLAHMSHEIRTPINAVIGLTHLLFDTSPDTVQKEYLESLRFSADSLLAIIDDMLDLSKIDAGAIEFEQKSFDLNYLLKSVQRAFQFKVQEKPIDIQLITDSSLRHLVIGDPTRLNQILTNLMGNAVKFTEKGRVCLRSRLLDTSDGKLVVQFQVEDTGIGIPEEKQAVIFENFKQADVQISRKFGGTGLGLTIVKQLVELQEGSIQVTSAPGKGSLFTFTIPFGNSGIPTEATIKPDNENRTIGDRFKGFRFLIVEDNLVNQKLVCHTIRNWKGVFQVATNGREAVEISASQPFDVILMDIHMPEMDGYEATAAIRAGEHNPNRDKPIIALTAAAMPEEKRKAFEVGMNGFLTKPFSPQMLEEHILFALENTAAPEREPGQPTSTPQTEEAMFDLGYLLELGNQDKFFVREIIQSYLKESPSVALNLAACSKMEDWVSIGKLVHGIKPTFALLGMHALHEQVVMISQQVKKAVVDKDLLTDKVEQLVHGMEKSFVSLEQYLTEELIS